MNAVKEVSTVVAVKAPREVRVVEDILPVLDTGKFEHMQRVATAMARSSLIPAALKNQDFDVTIANCFLTVNQAVRWGMDPFALMQHVFVLSGKIGYEGKVIAALVNTSGKLTGRLEYEYEGEKAARRVTVVGTFADTGKTATITGTVAEWQTANEKWKSIPDQMLAYYGARMWARRYMPELMLGIYADDELQDMAEAQALVRGADNVYTPAPTGDRPTGAPAVEPEKESEMWPLYDEYGEQVDLIAESEHFATKLMVSLKAAATAEAHAHILEANAGGLVRLRDKGHWGPADPIHGAVAVPTPSALVTIDDVPAEHRMAYTRIAERLRKQPTLREVAGAWKLEADDIKALPEVARRGLEQARQSWEAELKARAK